VQQLLGSLCPPHTKLLSKLEIIDLTIPICINRTLQRTDLRVRQPKIQAQQALPKLVRVNRVIPILVKLAECFQ